MKTPCALARASAPSVPSRRGTFLPSLAVLLCVFAGACNKPAPAPITVTYLDPEWSHDDPERRAVSDAALREFTQQTGIRVNHLPGPEDSSDQLRLTKQLLQRGAGSPDVMALDIVWPGVLKDYLTDLKPSFADVIASDEPAVVANYTVDGKLVAVPYHTNTGVLFYRTDLLKKYSYGGPPKTWDELETMALRIQQGERAHGNRDFWGYVWPGAATESLTCIALEWQFDAGGGSIVNPDKTVSVDNPELIRAWERAARWIGRISSPNVLSYQEWDAINAFHRSGTAAFWRGWMSDFFLSQPVKTNFSEVSGITSMPGGEAARVGTVGGIGLAVSRASAHPEAAIRLVRFLLEKEQQLENSRTSAGPPPYPALGDLPLALKAYLRFGTAAGPRPGAVARPSTVTGDKYDEVSRAYYEAVYAVLSRKKKAPDAATELQRKLVEITGFPAAAKR